VDTGGVSALFSGYVVSFLLIMMWSFSQGSSLALLCHHHVCPSSGKQSYLHVSIPVTHRDITVTGAPQFGPEW